MERSPQQTPLVYPDIQQQQQQQQQKYAQPLLQETASTTANAYPPRVRRISVRHQLFKGGIAGLVFVVVHLSVGILAPWYGTQGLWKDCSSHLSDAWYYRPYYSYHRGPKIIGSFPVVKALEVLAMLGILMSLAVEMYQDVLTSPPPPDNMAVESLAFVAGALGLAGVFVYGTAGVSRLKEESYYFEGNYLNWGFWLTTASCFLAILSAAMVTWSRRRHVAQTTQALADRGVTWMPPYYAPPSGSQTSAFPAGGTQPYLVPATARPMTAVPVPNVSDGDAAPGVPALSQGPLCYVMVQAQLVPAYTELIPEAAAVGEEAKHNMRDAEEYRTP